MSSSSETNPCRSSWEDVTPGNHLPPAYFPNAQSFEVTDLKQKDHLNEASRGASGRRGGLSKGSNEFHDIPFTDIPLAPPSEPVQVPKSSFNMAFFKPRGRNGRLVKTLLAILVVLLLAIVITVPVLFKVLRDKKETHIVPTTAMLRPPTRPLSTTFPIGGNEPLTRHVPTTVTDITTEIKTETLNVILPTIPSKTPIVTRVTETKSNVETQAVTFTTVTTAVYSTTVVTL